MDLEENVQLVPNDIEQLPKETVEVPKEVKLIDVNIVDENMALNIMISFLSLAQKRGAFGIDESAKIWECIKMFQKK